MTKLEKRPIKHATRRTSIERPNLEAKELTLPHNKTLPHGERMLRIEDVVYRTGLSATTIYRYSRLALFPRGLVVDGRWRRWRESDIQTWIEERISERDQLAH